MTYTQVLVVIILAPFIYLGCGHESTVRPIHPREYYIDRLYNKNIPGHERTNALAWLISEYGISEQLVKEILSFVDSKDRVLRMQIPLRTDRLYASPLCSKDQLFDALLKLSDDSDIEVRRSVASNWSAFPETRAIPFVQKALEDKEKWVRQGAMFAIYVTDAFRVQDFLPHLYSIIETGKADDDSFAVISAYEAIWSILYKMNVLSREDHPNPKGPGGPEGREKIRQWWEQNKHNFNGAGDTRRR